jgi:hypothetical protein
MLVILSIVTSCGYFNDDPVQESVIDARNLVGACGIDVDQFKKFLTDEIPADIDCLEENIEKYQEFVAREDRDAIGREELKSFVNDYFDSGASELSDSIDLAFLVNALVLNDSDKSISIKNIKPLFRILKIANRSLVKLSKAIEDYDNGNSKLIESRRMIRTELKSFSTQLRAIISIRGYNSDVRFNMSGFIGKLQSSFNVLDFEPGTIQAMLGFKKLMLGGHENFLTRPELFDSLEKLPDFGKVLFSVLKGERASFIEENDYLLMLREGLETIEDQIFSHRQNTSILTNDLLESLINFIAADEDIPRYLKISKIFRRTILNEGIVKDTLSYRDIKNVIVFGKAFLDSNIFFEKYKDIIDDKENWDEVEWDKRRRKFSAEFELLKNKLTDSFLNANNLPQKYYYLDFVKEVKGEVSNFPLKDSVVDVIGKGKILIVSGDENVLRKNELKEIITKSDVIANRVFDFMNSSKKTHSEKATRKLHFETVKDISAILTKDRDQFVISMDELLKRIKDIANIEEIETFAPSLIILKEKIIGGKGTTIRVEDVAEALNLAREFFSIVYYMDISYDLYEDILSYKQKLSSLKELDHPLFQDFDKEKRKELRSLFEKIVLEYRVYRNKDGTQDYTDEFNRTKYGLIELASLRFLLDKLITVFGSFDNNMKKYTINMDELNSAMLDLKPVLEYVGLWSQSPATFARNVLLLSDLFQGKSDGSVSIDVDEGTEFSSLALFSMKFSDEFMPLMEKHCPQFSVGDLKGFDVACYRKFFYTVTFTEMKLRGPLKKFSQYVYSTYESNPKELSEFHISVEGFARDFNDPDLPMTKRDITLLFGAFLNIESVYVRFDRDKTNILSYNELQRAFPIYEEALMMIGEISEEQRKFAKPAFFYVIDKKRIPGKIEVATYFYTGAFKGVIAKRLNIGTLLYNMVNAANGDLTTAAAEKQKRMAEYKKLLVQ